MRYTTALILIPILSLAFSASTPAGVIHWQSGPVETRFDGPAAAAATLAALGHVRDAGAPRHIVVQFDRPLREAEKAELNTAGLRLLTYLGDHAYFASVAGTGVDAGALAAVDALQTALPVERDWKLHPALVRDELLPWMRVEPPDTEAEEATLEGDPLVAVYVMFHPDVALDSEARTLVTAYGGRTVSQVRSVNLLVVELPYSQIKPLAEADAVQYIEPPLPEFSGLNNSNRALVGADTAQAPPYSLDGSGVRVLVYDGGTISTTHPDLVGRVRIGDGGALADHATHVAGTLGGSGAASNGLYRGMAPGVVFDSYEFETGGPLQAGFLYTDPGDLEHDYNESMNVFGSHLASNSIGSNVARNGFPCDWEGNYGPTSALIDAVVRGSLGSPYRVVWAGGNERGSGACGTTYRTIAPPSGAKNHLSIGALNSNNDTVASFSSWGPTDDGRLKPDFSAPGCQTNDDGGVTSCSSAGGYNVKCGTSMATPTVAGLGALLLQDFRLLYPEEPDFRNSTLKALLAHTAADIENPGPDYRSGYGSVRVVPAIDLLRSGNFFESELIQDDVVQVLVVVRPTDTELKVTLAWDDVPGTPNVSPALVNDLDLRVFDPNLNPYFPWTLDPQNPSNDAVRTQADHTNNLEQVFIDAPAPGAYLIEIHGYNVPQGPQSFSLTATPLLVQCSTKGAVELDRKRYPCTGPVTLEVNDCDLNTSNALVETVEINVASSSEPAGHTVTLTETGPETALFVGTITTDVVDGPDVLLVAEGDTITATYIDADDGFGGTNVTVTDTAPVDCTPPLIAGVQVVDIDPRSGRVTFTTDEPARVTVRYGTACGDLPFEAGAPGFNTNHNISITGLQDNLTYFFVIEAVDEAENLAVADNGGACFQFTTPEIPDFFTELFSPFDLENTVLLFAPNGSVDFYGVCSYESLVLPTDPTGGTPLPLSDTSTATVQLTGGHEVLLYGASYNTLYINSNGNITLDGPDNDSTESYADHFDQVRVAALFDDLDPSEGGQVSYKELADRVVVTWLNVPEDGLSSTNTFQIELFYDGRIQIAWTHVDANDGLAGLSAGGGEPIDFFPTDLSSFGTCGPRPPSAAGRTVVIGQERSAVVPLLASDDGLPSPPGQITYFITSLPAHTLRDAGNDYAIQPADLPYALVNAGSTVIYTPAPGFLGDDTFTFIASDGGTPPEGGDSNPATVILQVAPVLDLPLFDDFSETSFDAATWWRFDGATIDDVGIDEPSPPYALRLNGAPFGRDELVSHFVDLTPYTDVIVRYAWQRTGGGESPDTGENLWVEYMDADGVWQLIAQYAGDGNDLTSFVTAKHTLPPAALHDSFRLRFRNRGTAGSTLSDDWFVDDVFVAAADTPFAFGDRVALPEGTTADIALRADPNDAGLAYVVLTLPVAGTLADPAAGPIGPDDLPYALVAGNLVRYTPEAGHVGEDRFDFRVENGPAVSNVATINLFVEPVLSLPFFEPFATETIDPLRWSVADGVKSQTLGLNKPSEPYAARFNAEPAGGDTLVSYGIDLTGLSNLRLRYYWQRTGDGESPDAGEDLVVAYLNDLGNWVEFARYAGEGPDMTSFAVEDALLPADAYHSDFRVRFSNSSGSTTNLDDWFVDDIEIYSEDAPTAFDQTVGLAKYEWTDITLAASDPTNDPLTYAVVTLPEHGVLVDRGTGEVIDGASVPYTLGNNRVVRYIPDFGFAGADEFRFRVSDGVFVSNKAAVSLRIGGVQPVHYFALDTDPGWTTEGLWAFGAPQGVGFDPPTAHTGAFIYGYNLAGPYEPNINPPYHLTTTSLDCSRAENCALRFYRWLGVESAQFDHARIEISTDGVTWQTVWNHTGGNVNDLAWTLYTYDISAVADGQPAVYIRWAMGPTDSSAQFSGWHLDDIEISGTIVGGPGDLDGDADLDGDDLALWLAAYQTCEGQADYDVGADLDGDGCVTLADYLFWVVVYREFVGNPAAPVPAGALGDYNEDGFVDVDDWFGLAQCLAGPDAAAPGGCAAALDLDRDGDIDLEDVYRFDLIFPY